MWLLLGAVVFAGMALRPVGISVLGAITLTLPWYLQKRRLARALALIFMSVAVLTIAVRWAMPDRIEGIRELSALEAFGMSARWLDLDHVDDPAAQATLAAYHTTNPEKFTDPNWVRGPLYLALRATPGLRRPMTPTLKRLAWIAISRHPFLFLSDQIKTAALFVGQYSQRPAHLYPKEIALANGLQGYIGMEKEFPEAVSLVRFRLKHAQAYFEKIHRATLYPYESGGLFSTPIFWWAYAIGYVPTLALVSAVLLLWRGVQRPIVGLFLWTIFFHVLLNGLINGGDGRFALPVEPLYVVLLVAGLTVSFKRARTSASS
jgi:hypothetical protein